MIDLGSDESEKKNLALVCVTGKLKRYPLVLSNLQMERGMLQQNTGLMRVDLYLLQNLLILLWPSRISVIHSNDLQSHDLNHFVIQNSHSHPSDDLEVWGVIGKLFMIPGDEIDPIRNGDTRERVDYLTEIH